MISIMLSIFGVTFVYAGMLMYSRDSSSGIFTALVGFVMLSKPLLEVFRRIGPLLGSGRAPGRNQRGRGRNRHLKVVKKKDKEKPTIH